MSETLKYRLVTFIRYLGDSFFYPFFALFLKAQGLVESKIGFVLSISPLIGIITNPIYSHLCKNIKTTKRVLTIVTILEAFLILAISFSKSFILISFLTVILAFFGSSHYGLMDSLFSVYAKSSEVDYSSIRLWGSLAYIIGTSIGGMITKVSNYQVCFIFSALFFIISGFLYHLITPISFEERKTNVKFREILKNKKYICFVLLYVLVLGTLNAGDYFFSVYLESRSITSNQYGMIYSYYVVIEVILLFIFSKWTKKINDYILLVIAGICLTLRLIINGMYAPLIAVILASGLRGVSYAIILHTSFRTVTSLVGPERATKGIMFMTLCSSIYVFIFNNIDGVIIEKTNTYRTFYLILAAISCIGLIGCLVNLFINKKNEKKHKKMI